MEKANPTPKIGDPPIIRVPAPVIVDLGNKKKKAINKLKNGQGKLMIEVEQAVEQVRAGLPDSDKDKQIIPVLVIYRKKRKRKCGPFPLSPLAPLNFLR
jgi:hypothetical protein